MVAKRIGKKISVNGVGDLFSSMRRVRVALGMKLSDNVIE